MTHGEMWRDAIARRIEGYCKTRGFRSSGPIKVAPGERGAQYEYEIRDAQGNSTTLCVEMHAKRGVFVDAGGRDIEAVSAKIFDTLTEALARRALPSKKQLALGV